MKIKNILFATMIFASGSSLAQVPANGLAGYWPFDGNANDLSGNGNNGNANGVSYASDADGTVAVFHETSSVTIPDNNTLDFSSVSGVTIAVRVKQEAGTTGYVLIKMGPGGSGDDEYSLYLTADGHVEGGFIQNASNLKGISSVKVLSLNTWYDIVLVWKNNGNICLYIDGVMDNSTTSSVTSIQNTAVPLVIGDPDMNAPHSLAGSMRDISIYNRALTEQEIAAYTNNGLVAYYPFDGNANDESGNGNNGTVHGTTLTSDRCGNPGSAYLFNGTDSYIEIDHSASLDFNQQISISFWVEFKSSGPYYFPYHIIEKGDAWGTGLRENDINWGVTTDSGYFNAWTQNFQLNKFYHLAMTYDGSTVNTYVDGQIKASAPAGGLMKSNTDKIYIGEYRSGGDYYFDGTLDDMRIYNRMLEPREISALYNEGKCFETVYDTIQVYDTVHVTVYDTIPVYDTIAVYDRIAVTDTLIVDVLLTGVKPPDDMNTIKVYPNPANDFLIINTGNNAAIADYSVKITDQRGATVFEATISQPSYEINLSSWNGKGVYILKVYDSHNEIKAIKKIILQ
jgi:hypothetical protein